MSVWTDTWFLFTSECNARLYFSKTFDIVNPWTTRGFRRLRRARWKIHVQLKSARHVHVFPAADPKYSWPVKNAGSNRAVQQPALFKGNGYIFNDVCGWAIPGPKRLGKTVLTLFEQVASLYFRTLSNWAPFLKSRERATPFLCRNRHSAPIPKEPGAVA